MDKTNLTNSVAHLFRISGYKVDISVSINNREIDIRAEERQGLIRKIILIECADYENPVGVSKIQEDINKLSAAKEVLNDNAIISHVSRNGYTQDASGYALGRGVSIHTLNDLENQLINFSNYIESVKTEGLRSVILREYQPNKIQFERDNKSAQSAIQFLQQWLTTENRWLTLLGDYGVGKSWTLKKLLYLLVDEYEKDASNSLLPFFIPLQRFTKAFSFQNLVLQTFHLYGLSGIHMTAFDYLMNEGKIVFLLDSFDEMAQHVNRETIRENLKEMLVGISHNSKAIMTSRPNYFEGRAERLLLVEREGHYHWHQLDHIKFSQENTVSQTLQERLEKSQFARIHDLSLSQRTNLFRIVLGEESPAYKKLVDLFNRFQELENISQRAVIARLLTTVAETLASSKEAITIEGYPLIPQELEHINQAKIFEIVTYNLLYRDLNIGSLSIGDRLIFLRSFAIYLQRRGGGSFASPEEIRKLVRDIFTSYLRRSDTPEQELENIYRTCRRHSGLTTEGQFLDSSGNVDSPVDELDTESRVGFSHNSLREYLISDAISDYILNDVQYLGIFNLSFTDIIGDFLVLKSYYYPDIPTYTRDKYINVTDSHQRELLFKIIFRFIHNDSSRFLGLLGTPPSIMGLDLGGLDFSGFDLRRCRIMHCIAMETDFRKSDLRDSTFSNSIIERVMFDEATLDNADFRETDIVSIYVYDEFATKTTAILMGKEARQWLYSKGARVSPDDDLNPLMGKPWYEAAREVTRTLEKRISGTHQDVSLSKGTHLSQRKFAEEFVDFLVMKKILLKKIKSRKGSGWVVSVNPQYRDIIHRFSHMGIISTELEPFFNKHLSPVTYKDDSAS